MRKNIKKTQGFTLIELMVVTAIIGVLGAVAIPYYRTYILESRTAAVLATAATIQNIINVKLSRAQIDIDGAGDWVALDYTAAGPAPTANISDFAIGDNHVLTLTLSDKFPTDVDGSLITLTPVLDGNFNLDWTVDVAAAAGGDLDGLAMLEYIRDNFDQDATGS
ncbi:MAG: hypothetical protein COB04_17085 [Gammaproteobacteria bacterium]|nr:MAG: hypothetical protein COB04_17085 [Gammaproteobacteria bacterium]